MPPPPAPPLLVVGRYEHVSIPKLGLDGLVAKVDTGAYSGALHCSRIVERQRKDGTRVLVVDVLDPSYGPLFRPKLRFSKYTRKKVRSSNGAIQMRYTVKLPFQLGPLLYRATITLANRSEMRAPILLGRKFLSRRFVVDVSQKFCLDNQ